MNAQTSPDTSTDDRSEIAQILARRRLQILRLVIPGLLIFVLIQLPLASIKFTGLGLLQMIVALLAFVAAWLALIFRLPRLATIIVVGGALVSVMALVIAQGPAHGVLTTTTLVMLSLLVVPIILAGILENALFVLLTAISVFAFTIGIYQVTAPSAALQHLLNGQQYTLLLAIPLIVQIGAGLILFAGAFYIRRMEEELADTRQAYAHEKDLELLREHFISSINHELRSPLMALQGYIDLARDLGKLEAYQQQQAMLDKGAEVAEHLTELVRSILAVRRLREADRITELSAVQVASLVEDAVRSVALTFDARAPIASDRFHVVIEQSVWVRADPERLLEVIINLLTNAVKYSALDGPIKISAVVDSAQTHIAIRDFGAGIPPADTAIIFEPFVRLDRDVRAKTPGSGLGLAICRANMNAMGGKISVESRGIPGEGSTFFLTLPTSAPALADLSTVGQSADAMP